jgi:hypothetical protein
LVSILPSRAEGSYGLLKADRRVQQHSKFIAALHPLLTETCPRLVNAKMFRKFHYEALVRQEPRPVSLLGGFGAVGAYEAML